MKDADIIHSWHCNAIPWIKAVQNEEIESRKLVTNQAIIDAILSDIPTRLLEWGVVKDGLLEALNLFIL